MSWTLEVSERYTRLQWSLEGVDELPLAEQEAAKDEITAYRSELASLQLLREEDESVLRAWIDPALEQRLSELTKRSNESRLGAHLFPELFRLQEAKAAHEARREAHARSLLFAALADPAEDFVEAIRLSIVREEEEDLGFSIDICQNIGEKGPEAELNKAEHLVLRHARWQWDFKGTHGCFWSLEGADRHDAGMEHDAALKWTHLTPAERERQFKEDRISHAQQTKFWRWEMGRANSPALTDAEKQEAVSVASSKPTAAAQAIRVSTVSEHDARDNRRYIIKGLLAEGDLACLFGSPGTGKSILAPHLGYAVAHSRSAFGIRVKVGTVLYVAAEDPHGMRQRMLALRGIHGDTNGFMLAEGVSNLLDPKQVAELVRLAHVHAPRLIVIDTLALAFPGIEENGSVDMGLVVAVGRKLTATGAAVILIHHDTKAGGATPRGHSVLNGALDVAIHLTRDNDSRIVSGRLTKNRNGSCDQSIAFLIDAEKIGVDEDGDIITSPIASELSGEAVRAQKAATSLPAAAALALSLLQAMPANANGAVLEADWRAACCADPRISSSDDPKSRATAFVRAKKELIKRSLIVEGQGFVALCQAGAATFPPMP